MTDVATVFEERDEEFEEAERRKPPGEQPVVDAPDLLDFNTLRGATTDKSLADAFFRKYRHLFCNGDGQLYMYLKSTGRWTRTDLTTHIYSHVMQLSSEYYAELGQLAVERALAVEQGRVEDAARMAERQARVTKLILHTEKAATIGNVSKMVQSKLITILEAERRKMNPDPTLLACRNGVVDLYTGELRWPTPSDRITRNTNVDYVDEPSDGWWEEKVLQMCGGNTRLAEFLQVWFGYCSTGFVREHCMSVLYGSGRNGKNILMDSVAGALGDYAQSLTSSFLESQGRQESEGNNQIYMLAQLDGVRMTYVSETGERGKIKESVVKSLTGDKTVRARLARENFYEFEVTHKITVGTNHKPEISGTDDGVWERIRLVPMRVKFGDQEEIGAGVAQYLKDVTLLGEISQPHRREQVLRWVVEGAKKYIKSGLRQYTPPEISAETKSYRREQDTLGQFLQQVSTYVPPDLIKRAMARLDGLSGSALARFTDEELYRVDRTELWRVYSIWAADNGHGVMSSTMFKRRVTSAQRFWPGDGAGELVMRPLEGIRTHKGDRYVYFCWSAIGEQFRDHARRQQMGSQQRFEG